MSASPLKETSFFNRFVPDILSGKKVITIRDENEKNFLVGSIVDVKTFEENEWFCRIKIVDVEPISFDALNDFHATQENMSLTELKGVISDIYPEVNQLWVISYQLVDNE